MKQLLILISLILICATSAQSKVFTNFKQIQLPSAIHQQAKLNDEIKSVLKNNFGLNLDSRNFELTQVQESLLGHHLKYSEKIEGIKVLDSELVLSISNDNSLFKVYANISERLTAPKVNLAKSINFATAGRAAYDSLGGHAELMETPQGELVIANSKLVYKVIMRTENPRGDYEIMVDAITQEIISSEDVRIFRHHYSLPQKRIIKGKKKQSYTEALAKLNLKLVQEKQAKLSVDEKNRGNGYGQVFKPNPVTTLKNDNLEDRSQAYIFKPAYRTVTLENLLMKNSLYHLKSDLVELKNFESPNTKISTSTSGDFVGERNSSFFTDTMTYYHLYSSISYLKNLGFKNSKVIFKKPMIADSDAVYGSDNSYFSPAMNALAFGHGCVDDNEDSDVILHELGHAINFNINSSWRGGDTGAMGEGFGDYWAASYSYLQENGDFRPNWVFKWDGHNNCWPGRNVDKTNLAYDHNTTYRAHMRMSGGITDELWSTPIFQAFKELVDQQADPNELQQIIIESQFGLGSGVKMRDWANSIIRTAKLLFPKANYANVYQKHFRKQKIVE